MARPLRRPVARSRGGRKRYSAAGGRPTKGSGNLGSGPSASVAHRRRGRSAAAPPATLATPVGCAADRRGRCGRLRSINEPAAQWIFQPTTRPGGAALRGRVMEDIWTHFDSLAYPRHAAKLHGLWLPQPAPMRRCCSTSRRALGRVSAAPPHPSHARAGLFGARHRLPRLRPQQRPRCRRNRWPTRTPRPAGLARSSASRGATLHLRPSLGGAIG